MTEISIKKSSLDESMKKRIIALISLELDCNFDKGEYSVDLLPMGCSIGEDDPDLIIDCLDNDLCANMLPKDGFVSVIVQESGKWEGTFWHKYYRILGYIIESDICEITRYKDIIHTHKV